MVMTPLGAVFLLEGAITFSRAHPITKSPGENFVLAGSGGSDYRCFLSGGVVSEIFSGGVLRADTVVAQLGFFNSYWYLAYAHCLYDYSCVLCNQRVEETTFHLFFECPFSSQCGQSLNIHWDFQHQVFPMIQKASEEFQGTFFIQIRPLFQNWRTYFSKEAYLQLHRMRATLELSFSSWLRSLV
uniref:Reverse transcriptase zinc-binding domain-containing protein n=1 Tax=Setaria viridis TaxID=4556 RepID=A0A4U6VP97_SETVI|nr:hypothetical protein SEVIR_2G114600v2 [Setaria viridis]